VLVFAFLLSCCLSVQAAYRVSNTYEGTTFFDAFNFFTGGDPTHGYVNYVDKNTATREGLIHATADLVTIGCDTQNVSTGRGRNSVRLETQAAFNGGLFIMDLTNMPTGCGTWPAWWLCGPNWPAGGEIDIIEGVNVQTADQVTLHTNAGCTMTANSSAFTGHMVGANCLGNSGCGIVAGANTYGGPFNQNQGGVFALEWTPNHIQSFFFPRSNIPGNIGSGMPDPSSWGKPFAYFGLGPNCPASHFHDHHMIINLTFCGDWAGNVFNAQCAGKGTCNTYVGKTPGDFKNAFWAIKYVKVYQNA